MWVNGEELIVQKTRCVKNQLKQTIIEKCYYLYSQINDYT